MQQCAVLCQPHARHHSGSLVAAAKTNHLNYFFPMFLLIFLYFLVHAAEVGRRYYEIPEVLFVTQLRP